jgi:ribosomal protein L11 methyltransferase
VDYGCGSGILAIAAAKLGAERVCAVDVDPAALAVCRENAAANEVSAQLRISAPDALPAVAAELVVANILLEPLIALAPRLAALVQPRGQLLLSGLLREQVGTCVAAYAPWFAIEATRYQDEWALVRGVRE